MPFLFRCLVAALALLPGAVLASQACEPATWVRLEGARVRVDGMALIGDMARRDVVLLGETHDDADHHRWQLQVLAALHAARPEMVLGFEAFPRSSQPALDRWVAGELTFAQFLRESRWSEVWNFPPELYQPLFEFARMNRLPMVALNVSRSLTRAVSQKGWGAVPDSQREGVSRPAPAPQAYVDALFEVWRQHRPAGAPAASREDASFRNFVEAQQTWDRAFAEGLVRHGKLPGRRPLAVGILGSGHVRDGHGVPLQLRSLGVARVGSLLPLRAPSECAELKPGLADAAYLLPEQPASRPPPRLGVQLEQKDGTVVIQEVTAGGLAERSGLRKGDVVVSLAGAPLASSGRLVEAIRRQPEGTWLPLQVRRGESLVDIIVRFPPAAP